MELLGCASMMVMLVWTVFEAGNSCDEEGEINKLWFISYISIDRMAQFKSPL